MGQNGKLKEYEIVIPQFITHVPTSKTKFKKINGQNVYSGMNPHVRAKVMREMHEYLMKFIPQGMLLRIPISVRLEFHVPINYGTVSQVFDKEKKVPVTRWKVPDKSYVPSWDVDNQWIWTKAFSDALVLAGVIPDDNVSVIKTSGEIRWVPVDHIDDRKLKFVIKEE